MRPDDLEIAARGMADGGASGRPRRRLTVVLGVIALLGGSALSGLGSIANAAPATPATPVTQATAVTQATPATPAAAASTTRHISAATGCTNPAHGTVKPAGGLQPQQLADAYGLSPLWQQGYRGQGEKIAILLFGGESLAADKWRTYTDCWGPFPQPTEKVIIPGGTRVPGGEGIFDPKAAAAAAPGAQLYLLEDTVHITHAAWPVMIDAALNPANTGGSLVDAITISAGSCEVSWDAADVQAVETALHKAADLGVKVFLSAGDSGSVGSYTPASGAQTCAPHPVPLEPPLPGAALGMLYPGSSPYVTSVGGTELAINGSIPRGGSSAGGTVTGEVVWNEASAPGSQLAFGGGGGASALFTVADAPWQKALGISGAEGQPDISALAGSPNYPGGGIGTSGSAPFTAGAFAVVDGYLKAHGAAPVPTPLNPYLYGLATDPAKYASIFNDVTQGSNDLLDLGCCDAAPGFDEASGLGSINFDALATSLLPVTPTSPPASPSTGPSTAASTAPAAPPASSGPAPTPPRPTANATAALAATGARAAPVAAVGAGLLLLGALALVVGVPRRRRIRDGKIRE